MLFRAVLFRAVLFRPVLFRAALFLAPLRDADVFAPAPERDFDPERADFALDPEREREDFALDFDPAPDERFGAAFLPPTFLRTFFAAVFTVVETDSIASRSVSPTLPSFDPFVAIFQILLLKCTPDLAGVPDDARRFYVSDRRKSSLPSPPSRDNPSRRRSIRGRSTTRPPHPPRLKRLDEFQQPFARRRRS